jgi:multimeric flavodoxin WrbA
MNHTTFTGESTMKITTILGSARKKGNTDTVLNWVEEEIKTLGHEVQRVYLDNKDIGGCRGCARCRDYPDEIACVQKDDAIGIMENMVSSDGVLYASPIYFWGFSAQLKALIDRCYSLVTNYHQPGHTSMMRGKRIGLLVTGADAYEDNAEGMFIAFNRIVDFLLAENCGELYIGRCSLPDELSKNVKHQAKELARSLVN